MNMQSKCLKQGLNETQKDMNQTYTANVIPYTEDVILGEIDATGPPRFQHCSCKDMSFCK